MNKSKTRNSNIEIRNKFEFLLSEFRNCFESRSSNVGLLLLFLLLALSSSLAFSQSVPTTNPSLPTLWLVGDSTVRNGSGKGGNGQWGWGDRIARYFDTSRINVINRARGGRSSRTFQTEGLWDAVLKDVKSGDFLIIQMGHNDGAPLAGDNRERGSIRGIGEESEDVTLTLGDNKGKKETVHTYGWYMRKYVNDARAKNLTPLICSPIPRIPQAMVKDGDTGADAKPADKTTYIAWSEEVAKSTNTFFIPLNSLILRHYAGITPDELKTKYFTSADNTHTNADGADLNAASVIEGLRALKDCPLTGFLRETPLPLASSKP